MAYNTKPIVTDKDGNPISQYYNPETDSYEPVVGGGGGSAVILYNKDGTENNSLSLTPILDKLSQLTGTVIDEETRKSNELQRTDDEDVRIINENLRKSAETTRVNNESTRQTQETARQNTINDFKVWENYNNSKTYKPLNKVVYQGSSYICILQSTGNLPTNSTYWLMVAQKGQDGTGTGDMLKSVYDTNNNGIVDNAEKVNGFTVDINVPSNAKFTDTTYSEITTAEIDAGTASTPRTISGRRIGYIFGKISDMISTAISALTKSDVGLSNVDNVKQMPISNGVLENYREKLVTLSGTSATINLTNGNVFKHTLSGATTYSISNAVANQSHSFTLVITQPSTAQSLSFPASVKWQNGEIPDLSTASKTYYLLLDTIDGGTTWHGRFGGMF